MEPIRENIKNQQLSEAISERYLSYALSTIVARSLPDVRDGLKPVHRRLLYAMRQLKLDPKGGFKKCARVVGDVMGKYHPHGDASIYDAMVRLAQGFSVRYPLVDGQGNFGNIDGDSAAAMRYTEAKMTEAASALLDGLDEDAVDFMDTYTGEDSEPVVMPAQFPNLLANGANGIAVGMATNIPPHNVLEICDGIIALIKNPKIEPAQLAEYITAPDFPTGGILAQTRASIAEAYATGRGNFVMQAKWEREDLPYANYQIVITEIPYQVQKSRIIEKVAELMDKGKLPLVGDIRDESDEKVRIVIEPKSRTVEPAAIMAHLFMTTELSSKFALNMNVLDSHGVPRVMNIKEVLAAYVAHQIDVLVRRANFRIGNIKRRLEILGGLLVCYRHLDEVIKIIRDNDEPKPLLMTRFKLTEVQADAILNMRLRNLRKLEEKEIKAEDKALKEELDGLEKLVSSDKMKLSRVAADVKEMRSRFAKNPALSARRTIIDENAETAAVIETAAFMPKENITVIVSSLGWIKALKGHVDLASEFSLKEGDSLAYALHATTADKLILAASNGAFFTLDAGKLQTGRGQGDLIRLLVEMPADANLLDVAVYDESGRTLVATAAGFGFIAPNRNLLASTRNGKQIVNLAPGDSLVVAREIGVADNMVATMGSNRKLLVFPISELVEMPRGKGTLLQKFQEPRARLADAITFVKKEGIAWISGGKRFEVADTSMWVGKRANSGHMPPAGFPKSNRFGV